MLYTTSSVLSIHLLFTYFSIVLIRNFENQNQLFVAANDAILSGSLTVNVHVKNCPFQVDWDFDKAISDSDIGNLKENLRGNSPCHHVDHAGHFVSARDSKAVESYLNRYHPDELEKCLPKLRKFLSFASFGERDKTCKIANEHRKQLNELFQSGIDSSENPLRQIHWLREYYSAAACLEEEMPAIQEGFAHSASNSDSNEHTRVVSVLTEVILKTRESSTMVKLQCGHFNSGIASYGSLNYEKLLNYKIDIKGICGDSFSTSIPISKPDYRKSDTFTNARVEVEKGKENTIVKFRDDYGNPYSIRIDNKYWEFNDYNAMIEHFKSQQLM